MIICPYKKPPSIPNKKMFLHSGKGDDKVGPTNYDPKKVMKKHEWDIDFGKS